jgi:formate hydrogenlyase transcriptional activator
MTHSLLRVAESLKATADLQTLLRTLPAEVRQLLDFDYTSLFLSGAFRKQESAWFVLDREDENQLIAAPQAPPEEELSSWVMEHQRAILIPSSEPAQFSLRNQGMKCLCTVPLRGRVSRVGSLTLASKRPDAYSEAEVSILSFIADQLAFGIICHEMQKRSERAELILGINNRIASDLEVQTLLRSAVAILRQALRCDFASIAIPDTTANHMLSFAMDFPDSRGFIKEGNLVPINGSILGQVFQTRERIILTTPEISTDPVLVKGIAEGIKFACFCPLVHQDRTLGVLTIGRRRDDPISRDDADLLGQVSYQVAIALDNAMAYRQISELKDQLAQEKLYLEDEIRSEMNFEEIVGHGASLRRVLKQVETVAATDSNVLIYGETGTGKELIARAIHDRSPRHSHTFCKLNCAAIPTGLLESELFGHEKGAFTGAVSQRIGRFELAHRGTVFLDEIGEVPLELQPKLLRVLQEREFERLGSSRTLRSDARLIAATNRDLAAMVEKQTFRADLYYRLNVFPIHVPPLRERIEDIPLLVRHFVHQFSRRMNKTIETIPADTMDALIRYPWPGNIRELQNLIERAMILSSGPVLRVPLGDLKAGPVSTVVPAKDQTLEEAERTHILAVLKETKWVLAGPQGAAARLGMNRSTLRFRMGKLGIVRPAIG